MVLEEVAPLLYDEKDFAEYYPAIYVRSDDFVGYTRDIKCDALQRSIDQYFASASVLCMSPFFPTRSVRAYVDATTNISNNTDYGQVTVVWSFWLNFFVTLIIAAFVLWGVYCLAYVGSDASKDSLLFRATGRHHQN